MSWLDGTAVLIPDGRFDLFPQPIRRFRDGEQLAGGLGDGHQVGEQGAAKLTALKMGMRSDILA